MTRHPFVQLLLARLRELTREPEVLFWVFGFPVLLAVALGLAFRNKPIESVAVAIVSGPHDAEVVRALEGAPSFRVRLVDEAAAAELLRLGKVALVVAPGESGYEYRLDPTRPDSAIARASVDDVLQRAAGRSDPVAVRDVDVTEPGARYIDFLIPGLLGMNIMSGGMWGVGFVTVELRTRKLLKRLVATPMRHSHFLGAMMGSRMILVILELVLLLAFGRLAFHMQVRGSVASIAVLSLLGAFAFAGLGLLVGSRARKIETVSGLMNLVMLPMFVFSGIFFSWERFPEVLHPFIRVLPLTALNDALRAAVLEGAGVVDQPGRVAVLAVWGAVSFYAALRAFRWT